MSAPKRSRTLNRQNDRQALVLTLAGAGTSLVVMLLLLGAPVVRECLPDERGLFACLRQATVERLDLPRELASAPAALPPSVVEPLAAELDTEKQAPAEVSQLPAPPAAEPSVVEQPAVADPARSLEPVAAEAPATPVPLVLVDPPPLPIARPDLVVAGEAVPVEEDAMPQQPVLQATPDTAATPPPYRPAAGKLERPAVVADSTNTPPLLPPLPTKEEPTPVDVPSVDASAGPVTSLPLAEDLEPALSQPAETGSIEVPAAPKVEELMLPEVADLPQMPPPPLSAPARDESSTTLTELTEEKASPELSEALSDPPIERPALMMGQPPSEPSVSMGPAPIVERPLAAQPLPASALPPALETGLTTEPPTGAESAAAAAVALAEPILAPQPDAAPRLQAAPAQITNPPDQAEISPLPPEPEPQVVLVPPTEPTIDTIAFDEHGTLVAGDGPEGALIRFYVDAELAGEGEVLDGRWQVFGAPIFAEPLQVLRVEALDRDTGRTLGETEISLEIELPESLAPPADVGSPTPERIADADPNAVSPPPEEIAPPIPASAAPAEEDARADAADTSPTPEPQPRQLPPLRSVVPAGETQSVTILPSRKARSVEMSGTGFTVLGD